MLKHRPAAMVLSDGDAHGNVPIASFSAAMPLLELELGRDALDDDVLNDTILPDICVKRISRSLSTVPVGVVGVFINFVGTVLDRNAPGRMRGRAFSGVDGDERADILTSLGRLRWT